MCTGIVYVSYVSYVSHFSCLSMAFFSEPWLPVAKLVTSFMGFYHPPYSVSTSLSILLLVKGFTSTTVLPILNQSLIEGWENPSENSHVNMIAGYPTYVLVCIYIYYNITMEFILDI